MKTNLSNLWKKEDWLAVWIGFVVIAIACIAVLTGAFDFAAAKFSTWHLWENVAEKKSLLAQLNGAFWVKLLRTFLVLGVLFTLRNTSPPSSSCSSSPSSCASSAPNSP